jgi:hypothetical protein
MFNLLAARLSWRPWVPQARPVNGRLSVEFWFVSVELFWGKFRSGLLRWDRGGRAENLVDAGGASSAYEKRKSSAPHGAEHLSAAGGSRACRTPECAKLCSRRWQLRLCRMRGGASSAHEKSSAPHGAELPSAAGGSRACRTPGALRA